MKKGKLVIYLLFGAFFIYNLSYAVGKVIAHLTK